MDFSTTTPEQVPFWSGSTILFTYLVVCLTLALLSIRSIYIQSPNDAHRHPRSVGLKVLFITLAIVSLGTTWYHMLMFFDWSFKHYLLSRKDDNLFPGLRSHPPSPADLLSGAGSAAKLRAEAWLRDSSLFAEAWGAALSTDTRAWWTLQIFPMAAAWGVWLGREGGRRRLGLVTMMVFTFLGFLVAISFAMNLSLVAILCSPAPAPAPAPAKGAKEKKNKSESKAFISGRRPTFADMILFADLLLIPWTATLLQNHAWNPTQAEFMYPLLFLHANVILLVLGFKVLVGKDMATFRVLGLLSTLFILGGSAFLKKPDGILDGLNSHPAVTSVGWDVIMCWITALTWLFVGDHN